MPSTSLKQLHYAHTQNRIDAARTRKPYRMGLLFTPGKKEVIWAPFW